MKFAPGDLVRYAVVEEKGQEGRFIVILLPYDAPIKYSHRTILLKNLATGALRDPSWEYLEKADGN